MRMYEYCELFKTLLCGQKKSKPTPTIKINKIPEGEPQKQQISAIILLNSMIKDLLISHWEDKKIKSFKSQLNKLLLEFNNITNYEIDFFHYSKRHKKTFKYYKTIDLDNVTVLSGKFNELCISMEDYFNRSKNSNNLPKSKAKYN